MTWFRRHRLPFIHRVPETACLQVSTREVSGHAVTVTPRTRRELEARAETIASTFSRCRRRDLSMVAPRVQRALRLLTGQHLPAVLRTFSSAEGTHAEEKTKPRAGIEAAGRKGMFSSQDGYENFKPVFLDGRNHLRETTTTSGAVFKDVE